MSIMMLIVKGFLNKEIFKIFFILEGIVVNYISLILSKMGFEYCI